MLPYASEQQPVESLPSAYAAYRITSAGFAWAYFPLGTVLSNYLPGKNGALWVTHLFIDKDGAFSRPLPKPAYELLVPFRNDFRSYRNGLLSLKENSFNLFYTSAAQEVVEVAAGGIYSLICVHLQKSFLETFAPESSQLSCLLSREGKEGPLALLPQPLYLDPSMISVMNQLLQQDFPPPLAPLFTEIKIGEWLLLLLNRLAAAPAVQKFKEADLQKGEAAKKIIMEDFEQFHTIRQLARMVGTNEHKLKAVFRHLYGTTLFDYSRAARLQYARQLLLETDWTLQYVALAVGYPEASNFSVAFKQYFGYPPGALKKKPR